MEPETYLYSVVPAAVFRLTGTPFPYREGRRRRRKDDKTREDRLRKTVRYGGVSARCPFCFCVSPVRYEEEERRCVKAGSREREWDRERVGQDRVEVGIGGIAARSSCVASLCLCVRVSVFAWICSFLSIQVSWEHRSLFFDTPPLVTSVPSQQVTLTRPPMNIH